MTMDKRWPFIILTIAISLLFACSKTKPTETEAVTQFDRYLHGKYNRAIAYWIKDSGLVTKSCLTFDTSGYEINLEICVISGTDRTYGIHQSGHYTISNVHKKTGESISGFPFTAYVGDIAFHPSGQSAWEAHFFLVFRDHPETRIHDYSGQYSLYSHKSIQK